MCRLINLAALALYLTTLSSNQLNARDNGQFATSPLKQWFDNLSSKNGLCCSFAVSEWMSLCPIPRHLRLIKFPLRNSGALVGGAAMSASDPANIIAARDIYKTLLRL
jgi:hypothetical protein